MKKINVKWRRKLRSKKGMELVQVAILVALAVALGLIFKTEITDFVNKTFEGIRWVQLNETIKEEVISWKRLWCCRF